MGNIASGGVIVVIVIEFKTTHGNSLKFVGMFGCSVSLASSWDTSIIIILDRRAVVVVFGIITIVVFGIVVVVVNGEGPTLSPTISAIIIVGGDKADDPVIWEFRLGNGVVPGVVTIIYIILVSCVIIN